VGAVSAAAGDTPAGFWYGTDSTTVTIPGSAPYRVPVIGGYYGGYIGMAGNWAVLTGCHKIVVWSATNSAQANTNRATYHKGIGTGVYWFMGGPGVDPHYNGTTSEARAWGARQAARTLAHAATRHVTYPVIFADIELPGNAPNFTPAPDNGWNAVYTSPCSGVVRTSFVPASLDRAYTIAAGLRKAQVPQFKDTLGWVHYQRGEHKAALPLLRKASWARVVNVSAHSTKRQSEKLAAYTAAKSAMTSISKNMSLALAKEEILVNTVSPGS